VPGLQPPEQHLLHKLPAPGRSPLLKQSSAYWIPPLRMDRGAGCTTTSVEIGVNFNRDGWSDPAHVELMLMPMVNNAMASAQAAITKAFASVA
jgi:hypothetical protein